ncbi:hypothetical protein OO013_07170 [Mangrovivirga sp. M17]|uniref:Uncharacterized protein n=1 Tax=Mangrovivirga halotolerans TaxID=2993936 RepID=A0ABT3RQL9_9BACT|nr:hypothetical protein [Mangrovivirga halotolerans]MCX2743638.1 hypothetical protein [Mangrovivirga halotolerans]
MEDLHSEFVRKLSKLFGSYDKEHKRFEKSSNSEIARELGYSDAQFSRLINNSASEGEYHRAIQNVERILRINHLERKVDSLEGKRIPYVKYGIILVGIVIAASVIYFGIRLSSNTSSAIQVSETSREDMLNWAFETSFINSYRKLDDMPADCNIPCYKLQGKWELDHTYKLPFFRERNGFHYLATNVTMYSRCYTEKSPDGRLLEGYEYQQHEIWYDKRELPFDTFLEETRETGLTEEYQNLEFKEDENFVKLATLHTFFRNEFEIDSGFMYRTGKVIGRDLEFSDNEELLELLGSEELIRDIKNELNQIAANRLKDFSRPISCTPAKLPREDFHEYSDGDRLSFNCKLTTSRMSIDYTKAYRLVDQFIKNKCREKVVSN